MKNPIYVAFSTQKGGVGKTTFTASVASYLCYVKGYNVAIIDCDFPQHSILEMRKRDIAQVEKDDYYKRLVINQFKSTGKRGYDVIEATPQNSLEKAENLITSSEKPLDIIFFDMAGTVNNESIVNIMKSMDYIFTPIIADRVVMTSSLSFASIINDQFISTGNSKIKGLHLFWNMVNWREKGVLVEAFESAIYELGLNLMKSYIPNSTRFKKEVSNEHEPLFRSTLFPPSKSVIKGSNLDNLAEEIIEILNIK